MSLPSLLHAAAFYGSLLGFGAWALTFNLLSFASAWLPRTPALERFFQHQIQRQVAIFLRWLAFVDVVRVEYRGWENVRDERAVWVANHPGLLDAFYLLARVPRAFCIFKPAVRRNPLLSAAAQRAGYLGNDTGVELVRGALARIAHGASLIVFPEGTRTSPGTALGPLRPGFALIARRARVPVQLVRISPDGALLTKGRPWWTLPQLPVRVVVQAGPRLDAATSPSTAALVADVEAWFHTPAPMRGELTPPIQPSLTAS